eukprot:15431555-Alexandrium_andersonii.AAC.1
MAAEADTIEVSSPGASDGSVPAGQASPATSDEQLLAMAFPAPRVPQPEAPQPEVPAVVEPPA